MYIKGTIDYSILFDFHISNSTQIVDYVDTNYAWDLDKWRSTIGYVYILVDGYINWRSIIQKCIAQSITEAKYVTIAKAAKEAI